jgi:hypothetical protein
MTFRDLSKSLSISSSLGTSSSSKTTSYSSERSTKALPKNPWTLLFQLTARAHN